MPESRPDIDRLLLRAVARGDAAAVRDALDDGANPKTCVNDGTTVLHIAAGKRDSIHIAAMLLRAGADINAQNQSGFTPLITAIMGRAEEMVAFLIEEKADVNLPDNIIAGSTPLHHAASLGMTETARLLCHAGADPLRALKNSPDVTPLAIAERLEPALYSREMVEILIEAESHALAQRRHALDETVSDLHHGSRHKITVMKPLHINRRL